MKMAALAYTPSKYALSGLTLRSMVELERARVGMEYEADVFGQLSAALLETSKDKIGDAPFRLVEPGYYDPYERLARNSGNAASPDILEIQSYIKQISDDLILAAGGHPEVFSTLLPVCTALHHELLNEINAEDALAGTEWPSFDEHAQAGGGAS